MVSEDVLRASNQPPSLVGKRFAGRYVVEALLGEGGMGWVFKAQHAAMGTTVALKVMRPDVARDVTAIRRFYREAKTCAELRHHHTIRVFDFGISEDGAPFLVMEYLEGHSLSHELDLCAADGSGGGAMPPERVVRIARQIVKSLDEAHARGVIHRDLKPSNVFLAEMHGETDYVKVLDFGIAKRVGDLDDDATLTRSGAVVGTPQYLAPEQAQGLEIDARADLYALGVILFQLLTGTPPYTGATSSAVLIQHIQAPIPPLPAVSPTGARIPAALRALVTALLAKRPEDRPPTAAAVGDALAEPAADAFGATPVPLPGARTRSEQPPPGGGAAATVLPQTAPTRRGDLVAGPEPTDDADPTDSPPPAARPWLKAVVAGVALGLVTVSAVIALTRRPDGPPASAPAAAPDATSSRSEEPDASSLAAADTHAADTGAVRVDAQSQGDTGGQADAGPSQAAEKPGPPAPEKPAKRSPKKPANEPARKPGKRPAKRPAKKPTKRPAKKPAKRPAKKPAGSPASDLRVPLDL